MHPGRNWLKGDCPWVGVGSHQHPKSSLTVKTVGGSSSSTTNINYSFVQFWDGVFKIFFYVYSGRRVLYNVFVQFWDGVFINFFYAYSGGR